MLIQIFAPLAIIWAASLLTYRIIKVVKADDRLAVVLVQLLISLVVMISVQMAGLSDALGRLP